LASLTMILLAALLCNYGRGFCLIDIGTEGNAKRRIRAFSGASAPGVPQKPTNGDARDPRIWPFGAVPALTSRERKFA
jgi:hypothetical protein